MKTFLHSSFLHLWLFLYLTIVCQSLFIQLGSPEDMINLARVWMVNKKHLHYPCAKLQLWLKLLFSVHDSSNVQIHVWPVLAKFMYVKQSKHTFLFIYFLRSQGIQECLAVPPFLCFAVTMGQFLDHGNHKQAA